MTRKSFPSQSADSRGLPPLPESFVFGVANSDHQCEAYEPGLEDIRDVWERLHGMTPRGAATDFRRRYAEDVELARQLGCKAFRFSISWSRFEPEPGQFDDEAFEFYRNLVSAIRAAGMEPIVTLHHFTWPLHIEQSGGMTARDFPALFTRYAEAVANRLGQQVRYWLTFNEPGSLVFGYIKPWWESDYFAPPGMPEGTTLDQQLRAVSKLIRNLFRAHSHARRVIRHANPDAQVGANPSLLGLPNWLQRWVNWNATHVRHRGDLEVQARRLARRPVPDSGQVDLVAAMLVPEPVGARQLMFSQAYFVGGKRLLVKMASPRSGSDDLLGGAVGVIKGSTAERSAEVLVPGTRAAIFGDLGSALSALDRGGIDAILSDDPVLRGQMARHPGRYRLLSPRVTTEPYAVAVTPGSDDLLDVVELALRRFKASGAWAASYARHLGGPAPTPPAHTLRALTSVDSVAWARGMSFPPPAVPQVPLPRAPSGTALRRIQDRGYLLAAVSQSVPGLGSCDPQSGECSGLEIDLVRAVAEQIFADPNRVRIRPAAGQATRLLRSLPGFLDPLLKSYSTLSTLIAADWWHLGMAGKLAEFLCPRDCVGQQDFVGFDYYWGTRSLRLDRIHALLASAAGRFDQAPVWPPGLRELIRYNAKLFPSLPLWIVENGCVDVADRVDRGTYLQRHVEQVQRAVSEGANVEGYLCWSITSNREWGLQFGKGNDFGLYHIEMDTDPTLQRTPTPSADTYRDIIAQRGVQGAN